MHLWLSVTNEVGHGTALDMASGCRQQDDALHRNSQLMEKDEPQGPDTLSDILEAIEWQARSAGRMHLQMPSLLIEQFGPFMRWVY